MSSGKSGQNNDQNDHKYNQMTPFEFDTRMVEWNLKHEVISKDGLEKYLKSLPDDSQNGESLHIEDESTKTEEVIES